MDDFFSADDESTENKTCIICQKPSMNWTTGKYNNHWICNECDAELKAKQARERAQQAIDHADYDQYKR